MTKKQIYNMLLSFIVTFIVYFYLNLSIYYVPVIYVILLNLEYLIFSVKSITMAKVIVELFSIFISLYIIMSAFKGLNNVELFIYLIVLYTLIYLIIIHLFNNSLYKISLYFYDEGLSRFNKEKYKSALKYVFIARLFFDCLEIHEIKGKIYLNLDYYKRAVSEFLKCLNYTDQPYIYEYIAGAFTELNNEKKALEYRLQAYYISEKESKELNYLDYQTNLWELWRLHFKQKNMKKVLILLKNI